MKILSANGKCRINGIRCVVLHMLLQLKVFKKKEMEEASEGCFANQID
jgi:hypothetical protein